MVRLKFEFGLRRSHKGYKRSQFHYGSIEIPARKINSQHGLVSQFHYGSIEISQRGRCTYPEA